MNELGKDLGTYKY